MATLKAAMAAATFAQSKKDLPVQKFVARLATSAKVTYMKHPHQNQK